MSDRHQLGDLQLAIVRILWHRGASTVIQVHEALQDERDLSPSTIGTMLQKMERKGVVRHSRDGRRYLYTATVSEAEVKRTMVGSLLQRLFGGDPLALLGHLVREEELAGSDLKALRAEIERRAGDGDRAPEVDG